MGYTVRETQLGNAVVELLKSKVATEDGITYCLYDDAREVNSKIAELPDDWEDYIVSEAQETTFGLTTMLSVTIVRNANKDVETLTLFWGGEQLFEMTGEEFINDLGDYNDIYDLGHGLILLYVYSKLGKAEVDKAMIVEVLFGDFE